MRVGSYDRRAVRRCHARNGTLFESLEPRQLLSAAGNVIVQPGITVSPSNLPASQIQGYTPAQIRKAYGFDQFSFSGSAVPADGAGQLIAIVDPFNDPSVRSDLNVFDNQFGLPAPPSLTVVNHAGGAVLPATNGSWAGEIATDVEWAHATAPAADILLVEALSDNTDDLMNATDYARHVKGVSVISISWGGGEFSGQHAYDNEFLTPANHTGVTVLVAAGDNGAAQGAQWPASSPNVVSVGGSVLTIADNSGTYGSETSWTDTSGGYSKMEPEPSWQEVVQRTGKRSVPDIALNADTNIGQALYDTVPFDGITGWQTTNGTSVATPQWAGLIAISNQGRALAGQSTLDGAGQVLPMLYDLYGAPGTAAYSSYTSYFNDITVPQNPAIARGQPTAGYDATTGLGTPKAPVIINALINTPPASQLTDPTQPLASQLTTVITNPPKTSAIAGTASSVMVRVSNISNTTFGGALTLTLSSETSIVDSSSATVLTTLPIPSVVLGSHVTRTFKLAFNYPAISTPGSYYLSASAATSGASTAPADAVTTKPITIAPPFLQLTPRFVGAQPIRVKAGAKQFVSIVIQNAGNIPAVGTLGVSLYESADTTFDDSDVLLITTPNRALKLKPAGAITVRAAYVGPSDMAAGSYYLIATINSTVSGSLGTAVARTR